MMSMGKRGAYLMKARRKTLSMKRLRTSLNYYKNLTENRKMIIGSLKMKMSSLGNSIVENIEKVINDRDRNEVKASVLYDQVRNITSFQREV